EYPVVLAFGPGSQTMVMVETALARYWGSEAKHRGYIVVSPAAPGGHLFFEEGARIFPEFFRSVTGFPGLLREGTTAQIEALRPLCIYMDVGSRDTAWRDAMQQQAEMFKRMNYTVQFQVEEGQDHVLNLGPDGLKLLFDHLDAAAHGCSK